MIFLIKSLNFELGVVLEVFLKMLLRESLREREIVP
jgi:hypothetical protein